MIGRRELLRKIILRENAEDASPRPVCPRCRLPFFPDEADWLFRDHCSSCGTAIAERALRRLARERGRRRLMALLAK